jgi:hypothetical protein
MSHERLIAELAADGTPVVPLPAPAIRAARWVLLALVAVAVGIAVRGLRDNWAMVLLDPSFVVTTVLVMTTGISATILTMQLAVPGAVTRPWLRWLPPGLLATWCVVLIVDMVVGVGDTGQPGWGTSCLWKTWGIGVGPGAVLVMMARSAAPLDWRWTSGMAALAALAFGVLGTEMICPLTSHAHILTWHFLPVALTSAAVFCVTPHGARRRA